MVFKPKWYSKDRIIEGSVYSGKDRYGSEILAFYLSAVFKAPLAPIAAERHISITSEILPVATRRLNETINQNGTCLYGMCFYCRKDDPICHDERTGLVTGAVIFNVPGALKIYRSPWQRTYKKGKKAAWEVNKNYCT